MDSYGVLGTANPTLYNCLFYENTSATNVGAMYAWGGQSTGSSNPTMYNCAFINNRALGGYAGAFIADSDQGGNNGSSIYTMVNCIVWGNTSTSGPSQFYVRGNNAAVNATYSSFDISNQSFPHLIAGGGVGNQFITPDLINMTDGDGLDNCWFTEDDGITPMLTSPLINAGNSMGSYPTDILGGNRISGAGTDIGPYEYALTDTVLWTGLMDSEWFENANWNPGRVPDSTQVVVVPIVVPNHPIVNSGIARCLGLVVEGLLEIFSPGVLEVSEDGL